MLALFGAAVPAGAAKWRHCPEKVGYYPSRLGALSAPFIHPGRELGIFLSDNEVNETGGFSTEVGRNIISVTFASLFGDPVAMPRMTAVAVSPATLYFKFPDARDWIGRVAAGPVSISIVTSGRQTADILPRHLVALPPATDVGAMVSGSSQQSALATMDTRGAIWIPVEFSAYGTMLKPMPSCPMTLTPVTSFTVGVTVRSMPSFMIGSAPSYPPLRALRRMDIFVGDMLINGTNYYGMSVGKVPVLRVPRGWGIKVCALNDAVDLVLRAPGWTRWAKPWSLFRYWMPDSRPLDIQLTEAAASPHDLFATGVDAFGEECILE